MPARSFDPDSPGARHLAATWAPQRERWSIKRPVSLGHDGVPIEHEIVEVAAPIGRQLVADGRAEFLSRRVVSAHD
jgi:hypothetical protein